MPSTLFVATLALAGLAAAAPQISDADDSKPRVVVTESRWELLVRYAKYSAASYNYYCPSPPDSSSVQNFVNVAEYSTQAYIFRNDERKELILAFPGTDSTTDWTTDLEDDLFPYDNQDKCDGCYVHHGFMKAWHAAKPYTKAAVDQAVEEHPDYDITITGHSLGGALAQLAFASFKSSGYPVTAAYTYGQPRVGDPKFADYIDRLAGADEDTIGMFHRSTHTYDGVPQAPSMSQGYRHSRTEFFMLDSAGQADTYKCFGQEAEDCNLSASRGFINAAHNLYAGVFMGTMSVCGLEGDRSD